MKHHHLRLVPFLITTFIVLVELAISFNATLLPIIKTDFETSNQLVQMSIAISLFALGFAGLIYGGLCDVVGRRPMFLISTTLFSIMTLACAMAPNILIFLIARFFQGMGAGAGWVVGNACLNDLYHGKAYTKVMNNVHAIAGITPAIGPIIGSYLGVIIGWRNCFLGLFILSMIMAFFMFYFHVETIKEKQPTTFKIFFTDYKRVFHNRNFVIYSTVKVLAVMMIFCEIANLPLIFVDHLLVPIQYYGLYVFPVFCCYILAALLSSYLIKHITSDAILKIGLLLIFSSNLIILLLHSINIVLTPILIQVIKASSYAGWGFIFGNATALIVSSVPGKAGKASAIMIALEMLFSALGIYFLSFFFNGTIIPLSVFLVVFSMMAYLPLFMART